LHGLGVGEGQRERGPDASGGTNGAKEIGAFVVTGANFRAGGGVKGLKV
jgi:hypothetical protein